MPRSCKCILDRMVFKGAMTEEERDKIMRNLKGTEWHPYPQEKPLKSGDYIVTLKYTINYTKMADYDQEFGEWHGNDYMYILNNCIAAWAELPEPYKEGEEK